MPRISVLVPTYNCGRFLWKTLATIAKQDYEPWEVIVIDGGSTDDTKVVVDAYARMLPIRFTSEVDRGQLDAVQKGIRMATGDVLCWINADDAFMPGALAHAAKAFAKDPSAEIVYGDNYWFEEETRRFGVAQTVKHLTFWDQFLFYGQMQVESFFWRRELSEKAFPFDTSLRVYTDYSFFLPIRYGARCRWIPFRLGAFRVRRDQMSTVNQAVAEEELNLVKQRMCERLGISHGQFLLLQRRSHLRFCFVHKAVPTTISGLRFLARKATGDYLRRRKIRFFFDEWLQLATDFTIRP